MIGGVMGVGIRFKCEGEWSEEMEIMYIYIIFKKYVLEYWGGGKIVGIDWFSC